MRFILIKICNFLFGKQANNSLPRYWVLLFDIVVLFFAYTLSMFLVYYNILHKADLFVGWYRVFIVLGVYFLMFLTYRTYFGMIRYSGFDDIRKLFNACTTALTILILTKVIISQLNPSIVNKVVPGYRLILYHYFVSLTFMVLSRFTIRRIYNEFYKDSNKKKDNTIIYGAGEGGVLLFRAFQQDRESMYKIKAFTDDNPQKVNKYINTVPVLEPKKSIFHQRKRHQSPDPRTAKRVRPPKKGTHRTRHEPGLEGKDHACVYRLGGRREHGQSDPRH